MVYDHNISMANIDNIIVALNKGGVLSCEDLMERLWDDAPLAQVERKISAPRNPALHNEDYARKQIKQEIRRSLNAYFDQIGGCSHGIHRINPLHDTEHFYVSRPHVRVNPEETREVAEDAVSIMQRLSGSINETDIQAATAADSLIASIDDIWNELKG